MQMTLALHEIISWIVAAVSIALFIYERKKNNLTPFYMNLQGLLKSCHTKAVFYNMVANQYQNVTDPDMKDAFIRWTGVSYDFEALKQSVMGIMKAIEPNKDMVFDDRDYTLRKQSE